MHHKKSHVDIGTSKLTKKIITQTPYGMEWSVYNNEEGHHDYCDRYYQFSRFSITTPQIGTKDRGNHGIRVAHKPKENEKLRRHLAGTQQDVEATWQFMC